jgi:mono/diheme cytochrome c family protein
MSYSLGRIAVIIGLFLAPVQASDAGQDPQPTRTGKQVYDAVCIACHGPDGRRGVNLELE